MNQDAQYVYLGAGLNMSKAQPDQPILYERLEHHHEGSNVLFADGHVEFRKLDRITSGDFGLVPGNDTHSAPSAKCYDPAF